MKFLRVLLSVVLLSLATAAYAQSDEHKTTAPKTEAQTTFEQLKTLAGSWEGTVSGVPAATDVEGKTVRVTLRATSMGNALMHEMKVGERPDDPITMMYLDSDRLTLTHYCDAGNRPRMIGKISPDGKKVEFEFLDVAGNTKYGHMHHVVFTIIDANHHTEDWSFMMPGDKIAQPHFDLHRTKPAEVAAAR
jgi:hypothetical protein